MSTTNPGAGATSAPKPYAEIQRALAERRHDDAIALAEGIVAATPRRGDAWNALGVALRAAGRPREAIGCYRRALDFSPEDSAALANLGNALKDLQRYPEAIALHRRVLARHPDSTAWTNLGVALHDGGMLVDALAAFEEAIRLNPNNASAQFDRSQVLLRLGRFEPGWAAFEWRWRLPDKPSIPGYQTPLWDGRDLQGTLLAWPEQGFGDAILSVRFHDDNHLAVWHKTVENEALVVKLRCVCRARGCRFCSPPSLPLCPPPVTQFCVSAKAHPPPPPTPPPPPPS